MKFQENTAKFEVLEFSNVTYEEYVSRHQLDFLALQDQKLSPEKSKSSFKQKQTQGRNGPRMVPHEQLPASPCGEYGIFTEIRGFIEVSQRCFYIASLGPCWTDDDDTAYGHHVTHATAFRDSS